MSVNIVKCEKCGQMMQVTHEHKGKTLQCPTCENQFEIPDTKLCPFCSEEILWTAKKCKHCSEYLDETFNEPVQQQQQPQQIVVKQKEGCFLQTLNFGCQVIGVFCLIILGIVLYFKYC